MQDALQCTDRDFRRLGHNRGIYGVIQRGTSLEVELESFAQVGEDFFFGVALAGDVDFEALRDEPGSFTPNGRGEGALPWSG